MLNARTNFLRLSKILTHIIINSIKWLINIQLNTRENLIYCFQM